MSTLRSTLANLDKESTFIYSAIMSHAPEGDVDLWMRDFEELQEIDFIITVKDHPLGNTYKVSQELPVWKFDSSTHAYDMTQCSDNVCKGDLLLIEEEQTVGIAYTWPIAITTSKCDLHIPKDDVSIYEIDNIMNTYTTKRTNFITSFIAGAKLAKSKGYTLQDIFNQE